MSERTLNPEALRDLYAALRCFLEDERFHVGVGGNPLAVNRMIAAGRAALRKAEALTPEDRT